MQQTSFKVGDGVHYTGETESLLGIEGVVCYKGGEYAKIEVTKGNRDYMVGTHAYPDWKNLEHITVGAALEVLGEAVVHPAHYGGDTVYEVIKVAEAWGLDKDAYLFNVVKYVGRAGKKSKATLLQDLKKARFYLDRRINELEGSSNSSQPTS